MLYYRVKIPDKLYRFNGYLQTVRNELYTPAEIKQYTAPDKHGCRMRLDWLEPVQVSKRRVYWFFGARFESGKGWNA